VAELQIKPAALDFIQVMKYLNRHGAFATHRQVSLSE
jgi:hypothetical protein